jgi:hypothetical protein
MSKEPSAARESFGDIDKDFLDKAHCVGTHGLSEEDKARQLRKPHPAPSVQVG